MVAAKSSEKLCLDWNDEKGDVTMRKIVSFDWNDETDEVIIGKLCDFIKTQHRQLCPSHYGKRVALSETRAYMQKFIR